MFNRNAGNQIIINNERVVKEKREVTLDVLLGQGGYGKVFKGRMKMENDFENEDEEFEFNCAFKLQKPPNLYEMYISRVLEQRLLRNGID
ncbi:MAG: hypothetical protein EZS28_008977 [Streblomastix strix]|uniref:Protein kinase domain-containing protein n=1 Tax=Streblomastix strix TaxID=222440 RepID=A0A5J4WKZ6_9EUKA|nr:MAG: hypothetical protein EZS28_008977 [Streblomastix strix]